MAKILYFFPGNPLLKNAGNNARANMLLHYFKEKNMYVDYVTETSKEFTKQQCNLLKEKGLAKRVFLLNKQKNKGLWYFLFHSLSNKINNRPKYLYRAQTKIKQEFNNLIKQEKYDYIIISYASWASLIQKNKTTYNAKIIIDTHDFLTSQFQDVKNFKLGNYFENEIKLLNLADIIWSISIEEKYLFSQFINKPIHIIPHCKAEQKNNTAIKKYDIIYVASENKHNIKAIKWFLETVYPLLSKHLKILIVGKICNHIATYKNIEKQVYIDDLNDAYNSSKIAICPMLSGTGLKIKMIEALSFNLPIVCNEKAVDGFSNKTNNGCIITNSSITFKESIEKLLNNNDYYNKVKKEGMLYFNANYSKNEVYKRLDKSLLIKQ